MNHTEYKIRNLESQILYIQQEHASTLKLLHAEVKELQMKNSEMSFQLIVASVVDKDYEITKNRCDNTILVDQVVQLKAEVASLNSKLLSKIVQLESFEKIINKLTETVTRLKDFYKADTRASDETRAASALSVNLTSSRLSANADHEPVFVARPPISPKTFKFRNQITVHPENKHLCRRAITARQSIVAVKGGLSFTEYSVSSDDILTSPKHQPQPSILPPINPVRSHNFATKRVFQSTCSDLQGAEVQNLSNRIDINNNFGRASFNPAEVSVEVIV